MEDKDALNNDSFYKIKSEQS